MFEMKYVRSMFLNFLLVLCLPITVRALDNRLIIEAEVNGKEVRLAIDTGAPTPLVLLEPSLRKLRLRTPSNDETLIENLEIEIDGLKTENV